MSDDAQHVLSFDSSRPRIVHRTPGAKLNRDLPAEERRRLRAKLAALDAARPEPGLRQEGPEEVQLHKRVGLYWDVMGLAPMHLKRRR